MLPFILFVFALGTDWCRIFYATHVVEDCARSGALAASGIAYQERDLSEAQREARGKSEALKDASNLKPSLAEGDITVSTSGNYVTVTVRHDFKAIVPYLRSDRTWALSHSVRMPILP